MNVLKENIKNVMRRSKNQKIFLYIVGAIRRTKTNKDQQKPVAQIFSLKFNPLYRLHKI